MKWFTDCTGECCVCVCGDFCLAGHGDDDYRLATKEQIIARLDKGQYPNYTKTMINTLENVYEYKYNKLNICFRHKTEDGVILASCIQENILWENMPNNSNLVYLDMEDDDIEKMIGILHELRR